MTLRQRSATWGVEPSHALVRFVEEEGQPTAVVPAKRLDMAVKDIQAGEFCKVEWSDKKMYMIEVLSTGTEATLKVVQEKMDMPSDIQEKREKPDKEKSGTSVKRPTTKGRKRKGNSSEAAAAKKKKHDDNDDFVIEVFSPVKASPPPESVGEESAGQTEVTEANRSFESISEAGTVSLFSEPFESVQTAVTKAITVCNEHEVDQLKEGVEEIRVMCQTMMERQAAFQEMVTIQFEKLKQRIEDLDILSPKTMLLSTPKHDRNPAPTRKPTTILQESINKPTTILQESTNIIEPLPPTPMTPSLLQELTTIQDITNKGDTESGLSRGKVLNAYYLQRTTCNVRGVGKPQLDEAKVAEVRRLTFENYP